MYKITSKSRLVMGAIFALCGLLFFANDKMLLGCIWIFCSAVHLFDAYKLWRKEKESN
jgi:hypothetical protein